MSKKISDADRELFRRSVGDVSPVKHHKIAPVKIKKKSRPVSLEPEISLAKVHADRFDDCNAATTLWFARDGVQTKQLKKFKEGKFPCQAECDLHGLTEKQAEIELEQFIYYALQQGLRHIRIVHGQGYRSENQFPKLKNLVNQTLPEFADVLAFCSAQPRDGGLGAVYVLLKSQ